MSDTHLDLFSGIGGFALAAEWAGFETVMFCEIDGYCQRVLGKHWPDVRVHGDIRTLTADVVGQPVGLITGGFPCQPFSVAGERRGAADDRHLWPEMARLIDECRPRWVLAENVPGFIGMGLDTCLSDLESLGYEAGAVVLPACALGAWHRRDRVWILAHTNGAGQQQHGGAEPVSAELTAAECGSEFDAHATRRGFRCGPASKPAGQPARLHEVVSDATGISKREPTDQANAIAMRGQARNELGDRGISDERRPTHNADVGRHRPSDGAVPPWRYRAFDAGWWDVEPAVGRVAHGIPHRVDRLRGLGNAIAPQVAFAILQEMRAV